MNRRGFLSLSLLAPVAGVMAAREVMAAPTRPITFGYATGISGEAFIGESVGEKQFLLDEIERAHRTWCGEEIFGVDGGGQDDKFAVTAIREDESVSAQFESDLAFLRDEPGVAS